MNNLGQNAKHITSDANKKQCIPKTPHKHCISQKTQNHTKMSTRHFTMGMIYTTQLISGIILSKMKDPIQQTQQNKPNPYSNITFFKSQQLKNLGINGYKHEIL